MKVLGILIALAISSSALNENIAQVVIGSDTVTIIIKADNNLVLDLDNQENMGIGNIILSNDGTQFVSNPGSPDEAGNLDEPDEDTHELGHETRNGFTQMEMKSNDFSITFPNGDSITVSTQDSSELEESSTETAFLQQGGFGAIVFGESDDDESASSEDSESDTEMYLSVNDEETSENSQNEEVIYFESAESESTVTYLEDNESNGAEESGEGSEEDATITFGTSNNDETELNSGNEESGIYYAENSENQSSNYYTEEEIYLTSVEFESTETDSSDSAAETTLIQDDGLAITITFGGSDDDETESSETSTEADESNETEESEEEEDEGLAITITFGGSDDEADSSESGSEVEESNDSAAGTAFLQDDGLAITITFGGSDDESDSSETSSEADESNETEESESEEEEEGLAITITFGGSDDEADSSESGSEVEESNDSAAGTAFLQDEGLAIKIVFGNFDDSNEESLSSESSDDTAFLQNEINNDQAQILIAVSEDSAASDNSESSEENEYYGIADLFAEDEEESEEYESFEESDEEFLEESDEESFEESDQESDQVVLSDPTEGNGAPGLLQKIEELELMLNQIMEQQKATTFLSLNNQESTKA